MDTLRGRSQSECTKNIHVFVPKVKPCEHLSEQSSVYEEVDEEQVQSSTIMNEGSDQELTDEEAEYEEEAVSDTPKSAN